LIDIYFVVFFTSSLDMIPRAHSDPGAPRLDKVWKNKFPSLPKRAALNAIPIPPYNSRGPHSALGRMGRYETRSMASPSIASPSTTSTPPKKRSWFKKIIMAPVDFAEWLVKKWGNPSDACMKWFRVIYWTVLIVGGIISAIVTLAPFV
jgi:hypothetical protein